MTQDPKKITELRSRERTGLNTEQRQATALEQLADTLEAIRIDLVGFQSAYFHQRR